MQKLSTPKTPENTSAEPTSITAALLMAECQAISTHAMTTALSELLEGPFEEKLSPYAKRMVGACYQVAWAIEEMAEGTGHAIREALDIAYSERESDMRLSEFTSIMAALSPEQKAEIIRKMGGNASDTRSAGPDDDAGRQPSEPSKAAPFHCECSHTQMVAFIDQLTIVQDELSVARLALMSKDWVTNDALDSIGNLLDASQVRAKKLHADMRQCFSHDNDRGAA